MKWWMPNCTSFLHFRWSKTFLLQAVRAGFYVAIMLNRPSATFPIGQGTYTRARLGENLPTPIKPESIRSTLGLI